ncbi:MAG: hypothetical protein J7578_25290 [Chitinophagaceae bacterium]|nr:hypothetical protein [Chitinophagaceae bacterium]
MSTFFLVLSIWLLISCFGISMYRKGEIEFNQPAILQSRVSALLPYFSGFILPVLPLAILLPVHWLIIFILNHVFVYIAGPLLTKMYQVRLASGRGMGRDMLITFTAGVITLLIGLTIRYFDAIRDWLN